MQIGRENGGFAMAQQASADSIRLAVELAKEGMTLGPSGATLVSHPEVVAKFIEVVAAKIDELRGYRG